MSTLIRNTLISIMILIFALGGTLSAQTEDEPIAIARQLLQSLVDEDFESAVAVFDETIDKVCLVKPFLSFADIALSREYTPAFIPSTVAGAINKYDLPDLMAALCPRKVLILNPLTANGDPAGADENSCYLSYPRIVYTQKGAGDNFGHATTDEAQPVNELIIEWLR